MGSPIAVSRTTCTNVWMTSKRIGASRLFNAALFCKMLHIEHNEWERTVRTTLDLGLEDGFQVICAHKRSNRDWHKKGEMNVKLYSMYSGKQPTALPPFQTLALPISIPRFSQQMHIQIHNLAFLGTQSNRVELTEPWRWESPAVK